MNYMIFIELLKQLNTTEEVLLYIYEYFKNNVTYNYDELQVVKYARLEEPLLIDIENYIKENKGNGTFEFKEEIMRMLDFAFMSIEGRPLSDRNKEEWFKNFGKIIHHETVPEKKKFITVKARETYDEVIQIQPCSYESIYEDGMLKDGVCGEYSDWIMRILLELGVPCFKVIGKGTTGHAWNLIYLEDKNNWVHFDMTMVRFYLDNWTKKYGRPEQWVFATTEEIFNLQPERVIEKIIDLEEKEYLNKKITKDNFEELDIFLSELNDSKIRINKYYLR